MPRLATGLDGQTPRSIYSRDGAPETVAFGFKDMFFLIAVQDVQIRRFQAITMARTKLEIPLFKGFTKSAEQARQVIAIG